MFSSMRPLVASGEKPKVFFSQTEYMPFKCEYNSNFDHILVKKIEFRFSANLTALVSTLQWEWFTLFVIMIENLS